jgi:hypothetical protein
MFSLYSFFEGCLIATAGPIEAQPEHNTTQLFGFLTTALLFPSFSSIAKVPSEQNTIHLAQPTHFWSIVGNQGIFLRGIPCQVSSDFTKPPIANLKIGHINFLISSRAKE